MSYCASKYSHVCFKASRDTNKKIKRMGTRLPTSSYTENGLLLATPEEKKKKKKRDVLGFFRSGGEWSGGEERGHVTMLLHPSTHRHPPRPPPTPRPPPPHTSSTFHAHVHTSLFHLCTTHLFLTKGILHTSLNSGMSLL